MSRTYSSCVTETFCPLNSNSPFLLPQHLATSIPLYVTESGVQLFATQKPIKRQGQWKGMFAFFWKLATRGTGEGRLKNQPAKARDLSSTPGSERPPRVGNGNPLQYFCLGNPMDRGAWWTTVQGVTKSQTGLSDWQKHRHTHSHTNHQWARGLRDRGRGLHAETTHSHQQSSKLATWWADLCHPDGFQYS